MAGRRARTIWSFFMHVCSHGNVAWWTCQFMCAGGGFWLGVQHLMCEGHVMPMLMVAFDQGCVSVNLWLLVYICRR
jgi:hypothetical protein